VAVGGLLISWLPYLFAAAASVWGIVALCRLRFPTLWGERTATGAKAFVLGLLLVPLLPLLVVVRPPLFTTELFDRDDELYRHGAELRAKRAELKKEHEEEIAALKEKQPDLEGEGKRKSPLEDLIKGDKMTPEERKRRDEERKKWRQVQAEISSARVRHKAEAEELDARIKKTDEERKALDLPNSYPFSLTVLLWCAVVNGLAWLAGKPRPDRALSPPLQAPGQEPPAGTA
jgi:hypothetical protein